MGSAALNAETRVLEGPLEIWSSERAVFAAFSAPFNVPHVAEIEPAELRVTAAAAEIPSAFGQDVQLATQDEGVP